MHAKEMNESFEMPPEERPRKPTPKPRAGEHTTFTDCIAINSQPMVTLIAHEQLAERLRQAWAERDALRAREAELVEALRELHGMYASTWDRIDGALVMMDKGVARFEAAHERARALLAKHGR